MAKITREQVAALRELAVSAINSFIDLGATKDDEASFKKQIQALLDSGMSKHDLDVTSRALAKGKDVEFQKQLKYVRKVLEL